MTLTATTPAYSSPLSELPAAPASTERPALVEPTAEPADGVQTRPDLIVKNTLVLSSIGCVAAVAYWLFG